LPISLNLCWIVFEISKKYNMEAPNVHAYIKNCCIYNIL
jgi:hypothetical protein